MKTQLEIETAYAEIEEEIQKIKIDMDKLYYTDSFWIEIDNLQFKIKKLSHTLEVLEWVLGLRKV